jgi:hypothetical protein
MGKAEMKFTNGYKDGSGKGTICYGDRAVLRTHWGCSCCDRNVNELDTELGDKIVAILNAYQGKAIRLCKDCKGTGWEVEPTPNTGSSTGKLCTKCSAVGFFVVKGKK